MWRLGYDPNRAADVGFDFAISPISNHFSGKGSAVHGYRSIFRWQYAGHYGFRGLDLGYADGSDDQQQPRQQGPCHKRGNGNFGHYGNGRIQVFLDYAHGECRCEPAYMVPSGAGREVFAFRCL